MAQVELTLHTTGDVFFECTVPDHFSENVKVKVVEAPTASFTLDTTKPKINQPFTATCAIDHFNATTDPNYTVSFYSKRDGRLATYETVHGTSVLLIEKHAQLVAHHGPRTGFPVFDLKLVESQDVRKAEYWCELEAPNLGKFESKHWFQDPLVSFTSNSPNSTTRLGTCLVDNFEQAGKEYSVQFWTDLGPKSVNRLATYAVIPNEIIEFLVEEVPGWTKVQTGDAVSNPNFTVLATGNSSFHGTWWCVLGVGAEGSAGYREIKSSSIDLA